jgi:amino acid transporter
MVSYIISDINVLIFRRRLPKAPRTFKVPFGPVIPVLAVIGNIFMIWNITPDPSVRCTIFIIDGIVFVILAIYAAFWCRYKLHRTAFRPVEMKEVMAMENPMYLDGHRKVPGHENGGSDVS